MGFHGVMSVSVTPCAAAAREKNRVMGPVYYGKNCRAWANTFVAMDHTLASRLKRGLCGALMLLTAGTTALAQAIPPVKPTSRDTAAAQNPVPPARTDAATAKPFCCCLGDTAKRASNAPAGQAPSTPRTAPPTTPKDLLVLMLLGGILGMAGQGIRAVIGLKKMNDADAEGATSQFRATQLVMSLGIALLIGAIAGVLAAVGTVEKPMESKALIAALIAAGYAGTDFIEGFMKRSLPAAAPLATRPNAVGSDTKAL